MPASAKATSSWHAHAILAKFAPHQGPPRVSCRGLSQCINHVGHHRRSSSSSHQQANSRQRCINIFDHHHQHKPCRTAVWHAPATTRGQPGCCAEASASASTVVATTNTAAAEQQQPTRKRQANKQPSGTHLPPPGASQGAVQRPQPVHQPCWPPQTQQQQQSSSQHASGRQTNSHLARTCHHQGPPGVSCRGLSQCINRVGHHKSSSSQQAPHAANSGRPHTKQT
jgi:hypothetical protein